MELAELVEPAAQAAQAAQAEPAEPEVPVEMEEPEEKAVMVSPTATSLSAQHLPICISVILQQEPMVQTWII